MKSTLSRQFIDFLKKQQLLEAQQHILVAVSGGVDSMVLLHLLLEWQQHLKITLGVAHFNHQLRENADKDEAFVREHAKRLHLPFFAGRQDVQAFADAERMSLEAAGRVLRETFLQTTAQANSYHRIATAHHLDDQVETILMRMMQGSGLEGLAGIRLQRDLFVRPLLFAAKSEILRYAREKNIPFREDESNSEERFLRNRIRARLVPILREEFGLKNFKPFLRQSLILQDWLTDVAEQCETFMQQYVVKQSQNKIALELAPFRGYFSGIQKAILQRVLALLELPDEMLNYERMSTFLRWLQNADNGGQMNLLPNVKVFRKGAYLIIEKPIESAARNLFVELMPDSRIHLPGTGKVVTLQSVERSKVKFDDTGSRLYIDAEKCRFPMVLRNWQPGDRFQPLGMSGLKKVKDFLTDRKIFGEAKKDALVLESNGDIVALPGIAVSERYKIKSSTKRILKIEIESL